MGVIVIVGIVAIALFIERQVSKRNKVKCESCKDGKCTCGKNSKSCDKPACGCGHDH